MTTANSALSGKETQLTPSYILPTVLVLFALPLLLVQVWVGGVISLFGLFLMIQAATIRLVFTLTDLEVYRSGNLIRRFPYQDWQDWQIFWNTFPILFYFKEVKSIHFLPVLFDSKELKACLERFCPLP